MVTVSNWTFATVLSGIRFDGHSRVLPSTPLDVAHRPESNLTLAAELIRYNVRYRRRYSAFGYPIGRRLQLEIQLDAINSHGGNSAKIRLVHTYGVIRYSIGPYLRCCSVKYPIGL